MQNAPTFPEIYPHFVDTIANKALVIYNAKFDETILRHCCNLADIEVPHFIETHCAMYWYAKWIGDWNNYHSNYRWPKLPGGDHTAIGDCRATLRIIQMMANSFIPESESITKGTSQTLCITSPAQKVNFYERRNLIEERLKTYPNQDERTTATNHQLESLLAQKQVMIQGKNAAIGATPKEDLGRGEQQIQEGLYSRQSDQSSRYVNPQQIKTYMNARELGFTQSKAAYIAGFSERTGQRIESGNYRPNRGRIRDWRTRTDPLAEVWECELIPLLQEQPRLSSRDLLKYLNQQHPGKYDTSVLRTIQRRTRNWRSNQNLSKHSVSDEEQMEWMKRLQNGKIAYTELEILLADHFDSKDIHFLLSHIPDSPLRYRNRALAVLFHLKEIPNSSIARCLMRDPRTIERYIEKYKLHGISQLLDFSRKEVKKSQDPKFIEKVFEILHSPPSTYDINRTSWTMKDLHRIMSELGFGIAPSNIRQIIKDAGYSGFRAVEVH